MSSFSAIFNPRPPSPSAVKIISAPIHKMLYFCRSCNYLSLTVCGVAAVTARSRRRNARKKTEGCVRRSSLGPVKNLSTELVDCRPVLYYCLELEFTNAGARIRSLTQPARFTWLYFLLPGFSPFSTSQVTCFSGLGYRTPRFSLLCICPIGRGIKRCFCLTSVCRVRRA